VRLTFRDLGTGARQFMKIIRKTGAKLLIFGAELVAILTLEERSEESCIILDKLTSYFRNPNLSELEINLGMFVSSMEPHHLVLK